MAPRRNDRKQRRAPSHYTVDELAERTDLTPRTIRSYQTQGLIPPPERHGRVAYYDDAHLERLEEIAELKEEGLSLSSIQEVLARRQAQSRAQAAQPKNTPRAQAPANLSSRAPSDPGRPPALAPSAIGSTMEGAAGTRPPTRSSSGVGAAGRTTSTDREAPTRRVSLLASVVVLLLVAVAAVSSVVAVLSLSDADDDRERLGRQVSDLQNDLSRLDGDQGPPATVVVPGPIQQVPVQVAPTPTAPPATRTVVVTTPPQTPPPPPATRSDTAPPAAPPTTQPCTLNLVGVCVP